MVIDAAGNVYITGSTLTVSFLGAADIATIKYNSNGVQQWVAYYNGPASSDSSRDYGSSIAVDSAGNVYVTGMSFGTGTNFDYITIKYNSNGVQKWIARYNSPSNSDDEAIGLAVDNAGNVFVTGTSPGSGSVSEFTTIKYDSSGAQIWIKGYIGTGDVSARPAAMKLDASGNVYITGSSNHPGTSDNYATVKYNSAGVQQWGVPYFGASSFQDNANAIALDNSGNIYVTGASWGINSNLDYATIKYNSSGSQLWARRYNGPASSTDIANSMAVDSSGNVCVTGFSLGSGTSYDYATIKYNSNGDTLWVRRYDYGPGGNRDDRAFALALDNTGNVYVTGWSSSNTFNDYATIKYNSTGNQLWLQRYNGSGSYDDNSAAIAADNSGNVYITGASNGISGNFDYATIKYLPLKILQITALIEGFYNNASNSMVPDTITVFLRNISSPYAIIDSAKGILNSGGMGTLNFSSPANGTPYFIVVKHRNSIETWSSGGNIFTSNSLSYDFTSSPFQAFGSNLILKGTKYCIYSGDVDHDGNVDLTDIILIYSDASNYVTGYVRTDLDGNAVTDLSDIVIAYNNSSDFVMIRRP